jgi:hypothetical protein
MWRHNRGIGNIHKFNRVTPATAPVMPDLDTANRARPVIINGHLALISL